MAKKKLNVAMIGYDFMGRAHSNAWRQVARFMPDLPYEPVMKVVAGRTEAKVKEAAERLGWEEYATRWEDVIARKDIDIIDICTPGDSHMPIAIAAAEAKKTHPVREAARQHPRRCRADVERRNQGRRDPHALPQLPPLPGGGAGQAAHRRRDRSGKSTTTAAPTCRTGSSIRRSRACGGW